MNGAFEIWLHQTERKSTEGHLVQMAPTFGALIRTEKTATRKVSQLSRRTVHFRRFQGQMRFTLGERSTNTSRNSRLCLFPATARTVVEGELWNVNTARLHTPLWLEMESNISQRMKGPQLRKKQVILSKQKRQTLSGFAYLG